jgi:hypothetical protein
MNTSKSSRYCIKHHVALEKSTLHFGHKFYCWFSRESHNKKRLSVISRFRRGVIEISALLRFYAP